MTEQDKKTMNDVWRYLYPKQERKVSQSSLDNLVTERPKWKNLPTQAVRIPKKFVNEILNFAKMLDESRSIMTHERISDKDIEQAISILKQSLKLPANKGGAIKREIKEAINLLNKNTNL